MSPESKHPRTLLTSWVDGADDSEFPVQNLPFGIFSHVPTGRDPRIGVAIGDSVLDMRALLAEGLIDECVCASTFSDATLNAFMAQPRSAWLDVRTRLTALLALDGDDAALSSSTELRARCLVPRAEVAMHLPAAIGDYTDFYSSREHATNVGIMFRGKDNALQPNWLHLPVGYHGRASSVVTSGTPVVRPKGQLQLDKADPTKGTEHAACRLFDFELEMGFFVGGPTNALGTSLSVAEAEERIFGFVLCNDWSARGARSPHTPCRAARRTHLATLRLDLPTPLNPLSPLNPLTLNRAPCASAFPRDQTFKSSSTCRSVHSAPRTFARASRLGW